MDAGPSSLAHENANSYATFYDHDEGLSTNKDNASKAVDHGTRHYGGHQQLSESETSPKDRAWFRAVHLRHIRKIIRLDLARLLTEN